MVSGFPGEPAEIPPLYFLDYSDGAAVWVDVLGRPARLEPPRPGGPLQAIADLLRAMEREREVIFGLIVDEVARQAAPRGGFEAEAHVAEILDELRAAAPGGHHAGGELGELE
jgi:hypothetical protein